MYRFMPALSLAIAILTSLAVQSFANAEQLYRDDHVLVRYTGIEQTEAKAIADIVVAARKVIIDRYAFDMPDTVTVTVNAAPGNKVRLYTDGHDRMNLDLSSAEQLRPPAETGIYQVYGLCHELGHIAMYRTIRQRPWLNSAGAEGWAHFLGSVVTDAVHDELGDDAWCYPYDYKQDGTARLEKQLASGNPNDTAQAAALWRELVSLIGRDKVSSLFQAWDKADVDVTDPGAALRQALLDIQDNEQVSEWWNRAEPLMIQAQPRSGFEPRTAKPTELMRKPVDLALDDGKASNKRSIAGGGHAVTFEAPGPGWYLTQVRIFGSRYGHPRAPSEDFSVWLCDEQGQVIREFKFPYSMFNRGNPQWVMLRTEPTEVPTRFTICAGFNPTGTKGVYVYHDAEADGGESRTGLPGRMGDPMSQGDWLIRAAIDQRKDADALSQ